jgi:predicted transcriptional regulator
MINAMKKKTISLPEELAHQVAVIAKQLGISRSRVMRDAIAVQIAERERQDPAFAEAIAAAHAGAADPDVRIGEK